MNIDREKYLKHSLSATCEIVSQLQKDNGIDKHWQVPSYYPDIFISILAHLTSTASAMEELRKFVFELGTLNENVSSFTRRLQDNLPMAGLKVLEIGGPFGQVLHTLGAEVTCIDPDIEAMSEWHETNWKYDPRSRSHTYHPIPVRLNLDNWQSYLQPDNYDVSFSRWVLSQHSGTSSNWRWQIKQMSLERGSREHLEAYNQAASANESAEKQARRDLFTISALVTKKGGLVLHQGDRVEEVVLLSASVNLDLLEKREPTVWLYNTPEFPVHVFKKF